MIRQPTGPNELYAFHRASMAGAILGPLVDQPEAGWYRRQMVKKGCWVPARIWLHQVVDADGELTEPEEWRCEVDGRAVDAQEAWLWLCRHPISEREFNYLTRLRAWQRVNAPDEWDAYRAVDHTKTPIVED